MEETVPHVVGIVGASGSGKTALASALVESLRSAGLRVGYLEHAHAGFDIDGPDTDSGRLHSAGAEPVVVVGRGEMFTRERGATTDRALSRFAACDLVIAEGFHDATWPKIRVTKDDGEQREAEPPIRAEVRTDSSGRHTTDDVEKLTAELLADISEADGMFEVALRVDGDEIPLAGFAGEIIAGTVRGMVGTLKGVDNPGTVELSVRRGPSRKDLRP